MSIVTLVPVIGLVVPAFDKGGLEQVVLNLYNGYRSAGCKCIVLVENNAAGYMAGRLESPDHCFIFNRDESLFLSACRRHRITHLHYHYSTFGLRAVSRLGLRTIYTLHNVYTWLDDRAFAERAAEIMCATHVVAVSRFVRNYFCCRAQLSWENVTVVTNGTDIDALVAGPAITRSELGIPPEVFVFANIASTHRNKHQAVIVEAARRIMERSTDFVILLIGNVGDSAYHREIEDKIVVSCVGDYVRMLPYLPSDRLGGFYRDVVDCVLLPSLQEGCSNVVLEALAMGRSLILTDVGNAREAAEMSDRVVVVPAAYPDLQALNSALIDDYSRTGDTQNVDDIADAMWLIMQAKLPDAAPVTLDHLRAKIDVSSMIRSYLSLLRDSLD